MTRVSHGQPPAAAGVGCRDIESVSRLMNTRFAVQEDWNGVIRTQERVAYEVRSVQRALALLEHLVRLGEATITQLSQETGLHKSTAHRLLVTLEGAGVVRQNPANGRYKLGFKLMEYGAAAIRGVELRATSHPHLEQLARSTGFTVHLGILDHDAVLYIDKIEAEGSFRLYSQIGRRAPLHCTALGKVLLAYIPAAEQRRLLGPKPLRRYTHRTIVEPERILKHLKQVAEHGYAVDDAEHEDLIRCVAAPIRDHTRAVIAAVSATIVCAELLPQERDRIAEEVLRTAGAISRDLGFDTTSTVRE